MKNYNFGNIFMIKFPKCLRAQLALAKTVSGLILYVKCVVFHSHISFLNVKCELCVPKDTLNKVAPTLMALALKTCVYPRH